MGGEPGHLTVAEMLLTAKYGIEGTGGENRPQGQDLQTMLCHGKRSQVGTQLTSCLPVSTVPYG